MLPCCCPNSTCSWKPVKTSWNHFRRTANRDVNHLVEEDQAETAADVARMDVALLREQYNWTKEKQKHGTRVILFKQASEETDSGPNPMVSVVPIHQEREGSPGRQVSPVCEADHHVRELEKSPWRTHLEIYRRTCVGNRAIVPTHQNPIIATTTSSPSRSPSLTEDRSQEDASERASVDSSMTDSEELENSTPGFRKSSAPAVLSRQLSFGGQHPPPRLPSGPHHHFPFPQRKAPRKSEAARRLGMYSSF